MDEKKETAVAEASAASTAGVSTKKGGPLATAGSASSKARLRVAKAYKMYVGGAFVRSESGRYFQVKSDAGQTGPDPETVNVPRGSRKDELVMSLARGGLSADDAAREADAAVDRSVYYAGFADKVSALVASHNPVSGPHFGFSVPEPLGVVCVVAPPRPALLGLVSTVLPVITSGNSCVVLASDVDPRTAVVFAECLATSDLPGGVVNVLTGHPHELATQMAKHREVFGMDVWVDDDKLATDVEKAAADNVKRVKTHGLPAVEAWLDESGAQGIGWIERFLETKTIWHPVGL